jgi:hypothetical protein
MEGDGQLAHGVPAGLNKEAYSATAGRKFGLTVGLAFLILAAIARWRAHPVTYSVLGPLGIVLTLAAIVVPTMLGPVDRAWMKLAGLISKVTTPIFMGIVYYLILTPTGLLRRTFGRSALVHQSTETGFWLDRSKSARSSLDRQF